MKQQIKIDMKDGITKLWIDGIEIRNLTKLQLKRDAKNMGSTSLNIKLNVLDTQLILNDR